VPEHGCGFFARIVLVRKLVFPSLNSLTIGEFRKFWPTVICRIDDNSFQISHVCAFRKVV